MDYRDKAYEMLKQWKGNDYVFGIDCLGKIGEMAAPFGRKVLLVANSRHMKDTVYEVANSLMEAGLELVTGFPVPGSRPNSPKDDAYRITTYILQYKPDVVVAVGGGSTLDVSKAAVVLACLGDVVTPEVDHYFGTGIVSEHLKETGRRLLPLIAVQTSASSGSHLTKYANITDLNDGQKKIIVDDAVVPVRQLFDYRTTCTMPANVTIDGALDALSHTIEVFWGAKPENYDKLHDICQAAVALVTGYAKRAVENPDDLEARDALGLATDLGGYAIMVGGTSGGHLTSFSLVDCMNHGTACGLMNPYYAVFYNKAIQRQLKDLGEFYNVDVKGLSGRELAEKVSSAMMDFCRSIGAPTKLTDVPKFRKEIHVPRAMKAAKDPSLRMKLHNMPVPMTASDVDEYMSGILEAACTGDLGLIKEM